MSIEINMFTTKKLVEICSTICYLLNMVRDRLIEVLKKEEVSAYRICKQLGIDKGAMSKFLRGLDCLSIRKIEKVADHLGYDISFVKKKPRKGMKK